MKQKKVEYWYDNNENNKRGTECKIDEYRDKKKGKVNERIETKHKFKEQEDDRTYVRRKWVNYVNRKRKKITKEVVKAETRKRGKCFQREEKMTQDVNNAD